jgi:L-alanine-DL-glutamate epimerase-like enolase superfamily enzyme
MELKLHEFDLPLKYKFGISQETRTVQKTIIAEVKQDGLSGYGEAVANHKYYGFTVERMFADLNSLRDDLKVRNIFETHPDTLWEMYHPRLKENPFAQCALDMALWDLYGKLKGKKTWDLWGLDASKRPVTDYTIGIDEIDVMKKKLLEFKDWPVFKIKLGTEHDMEIIQELRNVTNAVLRIDANCAWTAEQTIEFSKTLKDLDVEFIEQPLPADDWEGMKNVFKDSVLPVIADESCVREEDVDRCNGYFHGVNIKVVKCGGLTPALRMIRRARELNMKVMVGCMTESTVGISGIAQLMPLLDYVDADGPLLLAKDIATGVKIDKGVVSYSTIDGNGVELIDF